MAVDFADGEGERIVAIIRRGGDIGRDTEKRRPCAFRPKRLALQGQGKKHDADFLQLVDDFDLIASIDVGERVVAACATVGIERVEQEGLLAKVRHPKARCRRPILLLHIEDDNRIRPLEKVRDHDADALAGAGGCFEQDMLGSPKAHELAIDAAEENAGILQELGLADLADPRPAGFAVELLAREKRRHDTDQADREGDEETGEKRLPHDRQVAHRP